MGSHSCRTAQRPRPRRISTAALRTEAWTGAFRYATCGHPSLTCARARTPPVRKAPQPGAGVARLRWAGPVWPARIGLSDAQLSVLGSDQLLDQASQQRGLQRLDTVVRFRFVRAAVECPHQLRGDLEFLSIGECGLGVHHSILN